jgi:hypothetical protein
MVAILGWFSEHLCFAGETGEAIGIGGEGVGQNFDGDISAILAAPGARLSFGWQPSSVRPFPAQPGPWPA